MLIASGIDGVISTAAGICAGCKADQSILFGGRIKRQRNFASEQTCKGTSPHGLSVLCSFFLPTKKQAKSTGAERFQDGLLSFHLHQRQTTRCHAHWSLEMSLSCLWKASECLILHKHVFKFLIFLGYYKN